MDSNSLKIVLDAPFVTRLLDVLASGVGALARPWMIRRIASADADALLIKARAERENRLLAERTTIELEALRQEPLLRPGPESVDDLRKLAAARFEDRELKRLHNIESVFVHAAGQEGPLPPDGSPDPDWVARFFASVQDVSVEKMQLLWGKILAGEIRNPGMFSLRTLDVVRNLSRVEAETFQSISGCIGGGSTALVFGATSRLVLPNLSPLVEAGLLHAQSIGSFHWRTAIIFVRETLDLTLPDTQPGMTGLHAMGGMMDIFELTESAQQLRTLIDIRELPGFVDALVLDLEKAGWKVSRRTHR